MKPTLGVIQFIIWYFFAEANAAKKALIFSYKTHSLISLPNNLSNTDLKCEYWASACPARNREEAAFNSVYSVYNKALFLKQVLPYHCDKANLDEAVCDSSYETSLTYSSETKKYEFGYEIFHETSKLRNSYPTQFHNYIPIKRVERPSKLVFFHRSEKVKDVVEKRKKMKLQLNEGDVEFNWIPLVRIKLSSKHFKNVEYEIRKNNTNPMLPCNYYSLGSEIRSTNTVNLLYSKETQKSIFKEITLPTRTNESDEIPEGACEPEYECLEKWPILPADQFQFVSDDMFVICSNITTAPIWKSTLKLIMEKLDKYLYVLYRMSGQPLRILAGVDQILKLPSSGWFDKDVSLKEGNRKIETPKIIYKMVTFKLNPCEEKEKCWYGVLIVIHNGPFITKKDLICDDQSGKLGWEEISYETWSNEGAHSKFIYVCEISKDTMKSVGLTYTKDTKYEPLSLLKFPLWGKDQKRKFRSIKGKIFDEMKRLSEPGAKVELDDGLIERPSIDDNFGSTDGEDFVYEDDTEPTEDNNVDPKDNEDKEI